LEEVFDFLHHQVLQRTIATNMAQRAKWMGEGEMRIEARMLNLNMVKVGM
jgi:hypothetical protein